MQTHLPLATPSAKESKMSATVHSGIVRNATVRQYAMMEGIVKDPSDKGSRDRFEPIVAEGQYVGAPTMPKGSKKPAMRGPKGGFTAGQVKVVGQN
jgi:hypothetical protein